MIFIFFSIEKTIIPCFYCALFVPPHLLHPTKSNLYLANSLAAAISDPVLYRLLTFQVPIKRRRRLDRYNYCYIFLRAGFTSGPVIVCADSFLVSFLDLPGICQYSTLLDHDHLLPHTVLFVSSPAFRRCMISPSILHRGHRLGWWRRDNIRCLRGVFLWLCWGWIFDVVCIF